MRKIALLFILISSYSFSQSVNDYQYVIVPVKFDFLKKVDQYGLNTLTKLLLQKYGFKAYLSSEDIPSNVTNQRCNFMYVDVTEDSGMLMTKVKVALKDCQGKLLYETQFGSSREKEYATAYNLALREAGKSFDKLNYKYNGKNDTAVSGNSTSEKMQNQSVANLDITTSNPETFYFVQPIANGYQVVDTQPKVIMKLFNTSQKDVFIGIKENKNGIVISKNEQWFFEYYENGKLVSEVLKLKF